LLVLITTSLQKEQWNHQEKLWNHADVQGDVRFLKYMILFKKNYTDISEYNKNRAAFDKTYRQIIAHNKKYKEGKTTFTLGINQFADLNEPPLMPPPRLRRPSGTRGTGGKGGGSDYMANGNRNRNMAKNG